ncbi:MAG: hypothetical protein KDM81_14920, partial [Verrucomicrobiae bacterium]|nr:hypothetical protein [Verrucomicrobiae bacterium]
MSSPSQASAPPKRRRLLRLLAWLAAAGLLLIIGAYVLLTSGAFIKGVVIPRVGRAMNAEVTVDAVSLHPFSQVVVRNLRVVPDGEDELLSLKEARLDYSLMRILRGHLEIESVLLDSPRLTVSQSADGHSNYDPLLQGSAPTNPEEAPSGTAPSLRLGKFEIRNATVVYRQETSADGSLTAEVTVPRFSLSNLANSETAQTELEAAIRFGSRQGATNHELAGTLTGSLTATLNPELEPTKVAGEVRYSTTTATGAFAEAAGLGARLKANITPDRFEELALDFARGDLALGRLTVSGPFSLQQLTGNLHCELGGIGPEVLSLLGGQYGIGFGRTQLAAAYDVRIADEARSVRASGTFRADQFGLVMGQVATPPLDLSLTEDIEVDLKSAALTLNRLNFEAKQNGEPRLTARLSQPLQVAWEKGVEGLEDSTFEVVLSN